MLLVFFFLPHLSKFLMVQLKFDFLSEILFSRSVGCDFSLLLLKSCNFFFILFVKNTICQHCEIAKWPFKFVNLQKPGLTYIMLLYVTHCVLLLVSQLNDKVLQIDTYLLREKWLRKVVTHCKYTPLRSYILFQQLILPHTCYVLSCLLLNHKLFFKNWSTFLCQSLHIKL